MGELAAAVGMASTAGGSLMEFMGAQYEGEATKAAALYNARAAQMQAREQAEAIRSERRQIASLNVTRVAKSGVRLEGSPLSVLAENAYRAEKQALNVLRTGKAISTLYRMEGRQAIIASRFRMAQAVFRGLGSATGQMGGTSFAFGGSSSAGTGAGAAGGGAPAAGIG